MGIRQTTPLLIDTDIGGDVEDSFALTLAALAKQTVKLVGVTTVTGDTKLRARIAQKLLSITRYPSISICAGIGNPKTMGGWEGKGILDSSPVISINENAPTCITDAANRFDKKLYITGIGPCSNIAKALEKDPLLPKKVHKLFLMGGFFHQQRIGGVSVPLSFEHNFSFDIKAFKSVLKAGFDTTILLGDATFTEQGYWSKNELEILSRSSKEETQTLLHMAAIWYKNMRRLIKNSHLPLSLAQPWLNDSMLMMSIISPNIFTFKQMYVEIVMYEKKYPLLQEVRKNGYPVTVVRPNNYKQVKDSILKQLA